MNGYSHGIMVTFLLCLAHAGVHAAELFAGAAVEDITPPVGIPMAGYYHARGATSVHDQLYARAIVLRSGETKAALVSLDLIGTLRPFVEKARKLIEEETGIPAANVMISATHTHTAPVLSKRRTRDSEQNVTATAVAAYVEQLPAKVAASVKAAYSTLQPAEALAATGSENAITFNRRFHMADGTVGWNPGKLNDSIVKPAGPIDASVPIVMFRHGESRTPFSVYVNYSVHLDNVGGTALSADLPFTVTENLRAALHEDLITVYTTGACGDLNHIDVTWAEPQKGHENAARMGTILAGEVLRTQRDLKPVDGALRVASSTVSLEVPTFGEAVVQRSREIVATANDRSRKSFMQLVHANKVLDVAPRDGKPLEVEVQVITLGEDLAWVALPGEVFAELGLQLKADSPFPQTIIAELANGSIGYIPSRRAYRQGNYEVVSARCLEGSGEKLLDVAHDLLKECYAGSDIE